MTLAKKPLVISLYWILKDTLKAFDDFKNSQKSVWSTIFWYVNVYSESVFNTLYIKDKANVQQRKKKNKRYKKNPSFLFSSSNSSQFYFWFAILIWSGHKGISKTICGIIHLDSVSFLLKFIFLFNKIHGVWL